jgi:hypothetical protein
MSEREIQLCIWTKLVFPLAYQGTHGVAMQLRGCLEKYAKVKYDGGENEFVLMCRRYGKTEKKSGDYRNQMNFTNYEKLLCGS